MTIPQLFRAATLPALLSLLIPSPIPSQAKEEDKMTLQISSLSFKEGGMIPAKHTCKGENISPPLKIESAPDTTKSIALICDDPDAPVGIWVHWVIFNLPPDTSEIPENIPPEKTLKNGAVQGSNDFRKIGYGGPCPPSGTHRYFFKVYALDCKLNLKPGASKKETLDAMKGHVLAEGQLMGKFSKS